MKAPRSAAASRMAGATITQPALELASSFLYLGWLRKLIASGVALASGARRSIWKPSSPWSSPPRASTMAPSRSATPEPRTLLAAGGGRTRGAVQRLRCRGVQRLDHLVGDVVLRIDVDRFLQD